MELHKALVTGGAGFIGSHLVDALVRDGVDTVVLDDLSTGDPERVHTGARLLEGDVADPDAVSRAVSGCDAVFHLAAHRAVLRSVEHPLQTDRANTAGTLTVLLGARDAGARRVVFASSSSVYGQNNVLPTPEDAPLNPRSPYAVTKVAGEHYCRVFWELYGLETVAMRYFNVFGPRQDPEGAYAAVIPIFIQALSDGRAPEVHGDGAQSRDFTFIDDVTTANLLAAVAPAERCAGRAFNIAGGQSHSLLDLIQLVGEMTGSNRPPVHVAARPGDVRHTLADLGSSRADLGYAPAVTFREGLVRTVAWFDDRSLLEHV